jgi:hypothetical protein
MEKVMKTKHADIIMQNKIFLWIALGVGLILMIPLIFTLLNPTASINGGDGGGWDWKSGDFVVMGSILFGFGSMFVLTARKIRKKSHRIAIAIIFFLALLWLWVELAVGLFTNWGS